MSERRKWLGGGAVALLIGGAIVAARLGGYDPTASTDPLVGQAAPAFELPLVAGQGAGDRVALGALRGEVVALDFWASWCGPCRRSIPALNQVHERYGDRVHLYGVNVEASLPLDRLRAAHRSFGADFPTLHDVQYEAQGHYGVRSIPTLVLIDRSGVVRHVETGVPDAGEVGERLEALLTEGGGR